MRRLLPFTVYLLSYFVTAVHVWGPGGGGSSPKIPNPNTESLFFNVLYTRQGSAEKPFLDFWVGYPAKNE